MWNILRRTECYRSDDKAVGEHTFQTLLRLEWKRSHRSQRRFVLMLLEQGQDGVEEIAMGRVLRVLPSSTRETDIVGWYKEGLVIGVIFTELGTADDRTVRSVLLTKVTEVLHSTLGVEQVKQVRLSFQLFSGSTSTGDVNVAIRLRDLVRNARREPDTSTNDVLVLKASSSG